MSQSMTRRRGGRKTKSRRLGACEHAISRGDHCDRRAACRRIHHRSPRGFDAFFRRYPDGRYTDIDVSLQGSRGVAQWTFSAERAGLSYRGVDLFEFDGDRIFLKDAFRKERSQPIGS